MAWGQKWLRRANPYNTWLVLLEFPLARETKTPSERQKKLRRRARWRKKLMVGPSPAAQALQRVQAWQEEIDANGITRADIARREGLTRARVTQLMRLLDVPWSTQERLLENDPRVAGWSVRQALRTVPQRPLG